MTHLGLGEWGIGPSAETLLTQHSDLKVTGPLLPVQLLPQCQLPGLARSSLSDTKADPHGGEAGKEEGMVRRETPFWGPLLSEGFTNHCCPDPIVPPARTHVSGVLTEVL